MNGWKYTRADGTDHNSGTVDYRAAIGKELIHPHPAMNTNACGQGYHLGKTLRGAGEYGVPEAIFRCSYLRKDVLGEDEHKVRVSRLKVIEEVPTWKGYGPRGKQVLALIESLPGIPWFSQVGESFDKPQWAKEMVTVDSWDAARDAAWDAAEIMGGIEDGYFSKLMEVYRAGHWPCSFDGKKLVVF